MLSRPFAVLNAPDGLAVKFSLPIGTGGWPAISRFETIQPMLTSVESSIETSRNAPSPSAPRRTSAAQIANAAVMPPSVSHTG